MTPFDQGDSACRCEWGVSGFEALALADVTIVVDVLSFSTCVDVAVSRGAAVLPYPWKDASASLFARERRAELAGARGQSTYSLSPTSFLNATPGLRCVLPSPNGAELTLRAAARAKSALRAARAQSTSGAEANPGVARS